MDPSLHAALTRGLAGRSAERRVVLVAVLLHVSLSDASAAQGVSTGSIGGTVRAADGRRLDGALVDVRSRASGYTVTATTRGGRFSVHGLEVGGPYILTVRRLGYEPATRDSVYVALGEPRSVDFVLASTAQVLSALRVVERDEPTSGADGGTATTISDSLLHRLPSLNRDMYDFVRLVPQVSTRFGGLSSGASFRLNNYLIDGVSDRQVGSNAVMGGARGGKSIPMDALKEYQVLLSPYDARYGDFAGLVVNAVTKSGTNEMHGSAFAYLRNQRLARRSDFLQGAEFERQQFGFTLGGPIVRNRAHFFVAPEFQRHAEPTTGPYVGQPANAATPVPVSAMDVAQFVSLLRQRGLEPGDGGRVTAENPVVAFFGRVDVSVPEWRSRVALRYAYSDVDRTIFARSSTGRFPLSSNSFAIRFTKRASALQLFTQPAGRVFNELLIAHSEIPNGASGYAYMPTIQVTVPNVSGGDTGLLVAGPPDAGQGTLIVNRSMEIADHLSVQLDARHVVRVGVRNEWFRYYGPTIPGSFGRWTFSGLAALERGEAAGYRVSRDFGSGAAVLDGLQFSTYVNDDWRAADGLTVSAGLRADLLTFDARPPYNEAIDSVFGRRTSDFPRARITWSPRIGFRWEPRVGGGLRIRGGAGVFAGRPPLGWLRSPLRQFGTGIRTLTCAASASGPPAVPAFVPNPGFAPNACANGKPYTSGAVDLVDRRLRMGEAVRASLAVDRRLPGDVVATAEALYTRNRSDFVVVNLNLLGPQGVDRNGRVMYGTLGPDGARPALVVDTLPEVIDLRNQSHNSSWLLTGQLTRRFSDRFEGRAAYTYSVTRDVQSLTDNPAGNAIMDHWAGSRAWAGRHADLSATISSFDLPHRVVVAATYVAPWTRWPTDVSVTYVGESGVRYTYLDSSATTRLGDLNADGTSANDPIYVPRHAADTTEILFDAASGDVGAQQDAFERFIEGTPCLRRQRGHIVERNSCVAPWVHTSHLSVRQGLPLASGHRLALQLDVFNVLNLLNPRWGLVRMPNVNVLQHVAQTPGTPDVSRSVFRFDPALRRYSTANTESSYQVQMAVRWTF